MGEVIQLQGDQRKDVQEFLIDKKEGLELDAKTIKVGTSLLLSILHLTVWHRFMASEPYQPTPLGRRERTDRSSIQDIFF